MININEALPRVTCNTAQLCESPVEVSEKNTKSSKSTLTAKGVMNTSLTLPLKLGIMVTILRLYSMRTKYVNT